MAGYLFRFFSVAGWESVMHTAGVNRLRRSSAMTARPGMGTLRC